MTHRIKCAEIWGGIRGDVLDVETSGIRASLFSRACDGGKGGDIYYFSVCGSDLLTRIAIADVMGHGEKVSATSQKTALTKERVLNAAIKLANRSLSDCRRALKPNGTLILNSGTGAKGVGLLIRLFKPLVLSPFVRQHLRRYLSVSNHKDLVVLKELIESGDVTPVIDQRYRLSEVPEALRYLEKGHTCGKVVVSIIEQDKN